jgi:haloalkane dehalogenase
VQHAREAWPFATNSQAVAPLTSSAPPSAVDTASNHDRVPVDVNAATVQELGIRVEVVGRESLTQEVRAVAIVVPDESRISHVHTRVAGWVEQLDVSTTGEMVSAGQPLGRIFSHELLSSQTEYLAARRNTAVSGIASAVIASGRTRLTVLGMTPAEIDDTEQTGEPRRLVTVVAPRSGVVVNRGITYLWRNIIPYVAEYGRCLAPDLVGMGRSGTSPARAYRFVDHALYVDAWFDALDLNRNIVLVLHDWGSALGFYWAFRHRDQVQAIIYMEAIALPRLWEDFPNGRDAMFRALRSEQGEHMVREENFFIEVVLPRSIIRTLSEGEMTAYRAPFQNREARLPTLVWPRELPIDGAPADVVEIVERYGGWLSESTLPKLFINADPGAMLVGQPRLLPRLAQPARSHGQGHPLSPGRLAKRDRRRDAGVRGTLSPVTSYRQSFLKTLNRSPQARNDRVTDDIPNNPECLDDAY